MCYPIPRRFAGMALVAAAALAPCGRLQAENVDLSTVPKRESVQLTIYNSEDLTLVRETRKVSFKKGENGLQFSWANTLIDPTSVRLRFLSQADKLDLLDTTFPHDKPQMLYWNVQSELEGDATVEITCFTSGISWSADCVAMANQNETQMGLEGFVRVSNNSGEQYEDAEVRLVVGKINLVEKIAQLARLPAHKGESVERLGRCSATITLSLGGEWADTPVLLGSPCARRLGRSLRRGQAPQRPVLDRRQPNPQRIHHAQGQEALDHHRGL